MMIRSERTGGVIIRVSENGFVYEEGPNSGVIGNRRSIETFSMIMKGDCELEEANGVNKKRYVLKSGKWAALQMVCFQQ